MALGGHLFDVGLLVTLETPPSRFTAWGAVFEPRPPLLAAPAVKSPLNSQAACFVPRGALNPRAAPFAPKTIGRLFP